MAEADCKKVLQSFNEIIAKSDKPTIPYASAELLDTTHFLRALCRACGLEQS